ncbi:sugar phosphate nucleotidyltransferase [Halovenus salina]|uniref:Sugar phosphate nucleotidyltransferase n=1 Tax=Halovenus salina TaxID=1510225 RepID=A0ABD5W047_9EURY|nr:sugar phosphate nucleotidyltransferase [Halovenus salina]
MIGVVPAAGEGTRLRPLTDSKPKGLVSVAGRPLLEHVFEALLDSGVDELIVVVGYRAGDIIDHFGESFEGWPITYVHQRERLGLGHAIGLVEPHVDESFVVLNGDNVVDGTLDRPIQRFEESDSDAVIAVEKAEPDRARETGVVTVDGKRVTGIVEKPDEPPSTLVTTGCYVLSPRVFDALELIEPSPRGEYELADALGVLIRAGRLVEAVELDTDRVNVNTPADAQQAEQVFDSEGV